MSNEFQFLIYKSAEEDVSVNAFIQNESIWITANQMAILFDKSESTIRKHINNVFDEGELDRENNTQKVRVDGVKQPVAFYNLDTIISVGYRVNSRRATQFRIWATSVLKEYMLKGFAMDDERLKQGQKVFGKDYFRELLERVRSIRASERRIWQQITDIFAECSIDYDKHSQITHDFYAMVQNKFHYAIVGQTAAEIVHTKADKTKENMGLTTWKNAPDGRILKSDVVIAKNYLEEKQIRQLERAVTGYFDYIEDLIEREQGESTDIIDDIVFEVELIKQIEINIDYILMLVKKYHDTHCEDKEVLITINKAIDASPELRSKKVLIETFIAGINEVDDIMAEWHDYVVAMREEDLKNIIKEEKLKPEETRKFLENAFRDGEIKTAGTDIDKLMPPVSRFGGGKRAEKKQSVIGKLKTFFEKYFGIGGSVSFTDESSQFKYDTPSQ